MSSVSVLIVVDVKYHKSLFHIYTDHKLVFTVPGDGLEPTVCYIFHISFINVMASFRMAGDFMMSYGITSVNEHFGPNSTYLDNWKWQVITVTAYLPLKTIKSRFKYYADCQSLILSVMKGWWYKLPFFYIWVTLPISQTVKGFMIASKHFNRASMFVDLCKYSQDEWQLTHRIVMHMSYFQNFICCFVMHVILSKFHLLLN